MTQEEKAKAYDEALERFKSFKERYYTRNTHFGDVIFDKNGEMQKDFEEIFPQLCEDEDERIRKRIVWLLNNYIGKWDYPETKEECLAWLEKQKEQKPWKVGANAYFTPEQKPAEVDESTKRLNDNWMKQHFDDSEEQKTVESISQLTVKDKGVYKICPHCKERMIRDDSKVYTSMPPQYGYNCPKCGAMEFDTVKYDNPEMEAHKSDSLIYDKDLDKAAREFYLSGGADSPVDSTGLVPIVRMAEFGATWMKERMEKEQKPVKSIFPHGLGEVHFNPISVVEQKSAECVLPEDFEEAVYKVANFISPFDSQEELRKTSHRFAEQLLSLAKKELDKPAEWSEEDEEMRKLLIAIFEVNHPNGFFKANEINTTNMRGVHTEEIISWLKSLRPSWKPSEEDIKMLEHIIGQYETGNKNSKVMGYLPRVEELSFLKNVLSKWKN